jgi:peptidoglycan/xylan/chitin deacetylase (PgdA/CDA1 family)
MEAVPGTPSLSGTLFPAVATGHLAVTIDDLPTHGPLPGVSRARRWPTVIEVLRRHGIRDAVGFINGGQIAERPNRHHPEHWIAAGYRLGNHTFGHVDLDRTGRDGFR